VGKDRGVERHFLLGQAAAEAEVAARRRDLAVVAEVEGVPRRGRVGEAVVAPLPLRPQKLCCVDS
jgi:hypothetical protein